MLSKHTYFSVVLVAFVAVYVELITYY